MTIDLSGCSRRAQGRDQLAHLCRRARRLQGADRPLDPVNEGSFRALKVIIPEGNIMMARFPAPMAGWSAIVPTVVDTIVRALRRRHAGPGAGRPPRPPRRRGGVLRHRIPRPGAASSCRASKAAAGAAGRSRTASRHGVGLPGRRAQRLDRGHRAEVPGGGGERGLRQDSCGAGKFRGGLGIDMRVRNLVEAGGISSSRAAASARPGASGAASRASPAAIC